MAALSNPDLSIEVLLTSDRENFTLEDTTTNYGGGTHIASTAVQTCKIRIYEYGSTVPTLITLTVVTGTITAASLTEPDGTVTNILSQLTYTSFPPGSATLFTIKGTWLGFDTDEVISDQVWTVSYEIIGQYNNGGTDYEFDLTTTETFLVSCTADCCIKKMFVNLGCASCSDSNRDSAMRARTSLLSAQYAADLGQYECAQNALEKAQEICNCSCSDC